MEEFPGNIENLFKAAQKLKEDIRAAQESAESKEVEASAGGGMVLAKVSGAGKVKSLKIDREVVNPDDIEMLQDLIVSAVNEGLRRARELAGEQVAHAASGLSLTDILGSGFKFGS